MQPSRTVLFVLLLITTSLLFNSNVAEIALDSCHSDTAALLTRTKRAIYHAYHAYKHNALPYDELRPLSCTGADTFGGLSVTLVDTLDTFIVLRDWPEFVWGARYLAHNLSFDRNTTVSVFEITIRVLGGLLSAHGFLTEGFEDSAFDAWLWWPRYDDSLLYLAWQLAERLMPAFNTPTAIPFGAVHLQHGVLEDESLVASTAGAGTLLLEFGALSRYTGDDTYYNAAFAAMHGLHSRAANTGLVGNHINIISGDWVAGESGVGGLIDSFYEYMLKGYILFGDDRLLTMFESSYKAVQTFVKKGEWYLDADMWSGMTASLSQSSLSAFFPGLQVLMGLHDEAAVTTRAHYAVWRKYGALPEGYDVHARKPVEEMINYPLRPELIESVFYLHWATRDPVWFGVARGVLAALEVVPRVDCGFAQVRNVVTHELDDLMDSFVMSETLKYVYLVLLNDNSHWSRSGRYVFTTEAHPLRVGPAIRDPNKGQRWKCARPPRGQKLLPCGYGLGGVDTPVFDISKLRPEPLADDVVSQINALIREVGVHGVQIGRLFVGRESAYRVVKVQNEEVVFAKIARDAVGNGSRSRPACSRVAAREAVHGVCVWRKRQTQT